MRSELREYKVIILVLIFAGILLSGCVSNNTSKSEGTGIDNGAGVDDEGTILDEGIANEEVDAGNTNETIDEGTANETVNEEITNETIDEEIVANETEQTSGEEIVDSARIESDSAIINSDGLKIRLRIYNDEGNVNKSEGTLNIMLYEIKDSDEGPIKGNELDRWELQITDSDYGGNNELAKTLEYHKNITSSSGLVNIDYIFTTKDGQNLETSDEYINFLS